MQFTRSLLELASKQRDLSRLAGLLLCACLCFAAETVETPFAGITHVDRTEQSPRSLHLHLLKIELKTPGLRFVLTPPSGTLETVRQTTLEFAQEWRAQVAVNAHFFLPWPSQAPEANLVGFAASGGTVFSSFEIPTQSYALMANAPALHIDPSNQASIVHRHPESPSKTLEPVVIGTAVSGSAQVITNGVKTIPQYGEQGLTTGGPGNYSNEKSWYDAVNARTMIGLSEDSTTLFLFTVDAMKIGEAADLLLKDYGVYNALNLDGGGSSTMVIDGKIVNRSTDNPNGRAVGSNLGVLVHR